MPYQDPDPTDPMTLHGVEVEAQGVEAMVDMAVCFIEEYARAGFDADRIMRMFHTRSYAGPALALRTLGERRIRELIADEIAIRGSRRLGRERLATTSAGIELPVLETGG
ncbi:MAG: hypothetical protein KDI19_12505 [Pseudomonadales bacterium]|nr:hypothetical protein [Pseudomonadales bacterium]